MRFNADGSEIVGGANDEHLYINRREVNRCVLSLRAHEDDINAVAFVDAGAHLIASASDDGLCKVWDRRTIGDAAGGGGAARVVAPVGVFAGHRDGITFIDARGDDRYVLTNAKDQCIKLWDLR